MVAINDETTTYNNVEALSSSDCLPSAFRSQLTLRREDSEKHGLKTRITVRFVERIDVPRGLSVPPLSFPSRTRRVPPAELKSSERNSLELCAAKHLLKEG